MKHQGHEYEIYFCSPDKYKGEEKGLFKIHMAIPAGNAYYKTYEDAEKKAISIIDKFVKEIPQTKKEWLEAMSNCMVWDGYAGCNLDAIMVWDLLQKASKHLKPEGGKS